MSRNDELWNVCRRLAAPIVERLFTIPYGGKAVCVRFYDADDEHLSSRNQEAITNEITDALYEAVTKAASS